VSRAAAIRLSISLVRRAQVALLLDIEHGLCSIQCAGATHHETKCKCVCRGRNHGALWIIDTEDHRHG